MKKRTRACRMGLFHLLGFMSCMLHCAQGQTQSDAIHFILNNSQHKTHVAPNFEEIKGAVVKVSFYVLSVNSISDSNMDYEMTIHLQQSWIDKRLRYREQFPGIKRLEIDSTIVHKFWFPDIAFDNAKTARFHWVTAPNRLMHVYPDGWVYSLVKLTVLLRCDMDLRKFPFDSQMCTMRLTSYQYIRKTIIFEWHKPSMFSRKNIKIPEFRLTSAEHIYCFPPNGPVDQFSCLESRFYIRRAYGYYVTEIYIPSILMVILSWVSFWLDIEAVPARITLGLLTVLTMTTQSANAGIDLPKISYIKAIDLWVATCLFFVFAALVEFAYANVTARLEDWFTWCGQVHFDSLTDIMETLAEAQAEAHERQSLAHDRLSRRHPSYHRMSAPVKSETSHTSIALKTANSNQSSTVGVLDMSIRSSVYSQRSPTGTGETSIDPRKSPSLKSIVSKGGVSADGTQPAARFNDDPVFGNIPRAEQTNDRAIERAKRLDRFSRVAFPVAFGCFNLFYWVFYLT